MTSASDLPPLREGVSLPLGQSFFSDVKCYNFAIYSKFAKTVKLLLIAGDFKTKVWEFDLDWTRNKTQRTWHLSVPEEYIDKHGVVYYAYTVGGDARGPGPFDFNAFDTEKITVDPCAIDVHFPPDYDRMAAIHPGSNLGKAPLAKLCKDRLRNEEICYMPFPLNPSQQVIIYELHIKGFTKSDPSIDPSHRGTYAGAIDKIPYLQDLGVTAVELLPVYQFDSATGDGGRRQYWGYDPLFFFAPHSQYAADQLNSRDEFKKMVDEFHKAGIEVILDVVYNHTGEGNHQGPKFTLKLIDNSSYYICVNGQNYYNDFSGTGNSLHSSNFATQQLILDSLRYWRTHMGVDGFRFDLASVLARNTDGSVDMNKPPVFSQIALDGILRGARLIAEPWDIQHSQLGSQFPGTHWFQWNGSYRDVLQRFVKGDSGEIGHLAARIYGSTDLFPDEFDRHYRPFQSINYIVSHDGFTLYDLVSYDRKHNEANGENNQDGTTDHSWNCGWEGDWNVPGEILALRKRQIKNFFAILMLSNGVPMIRMGDEFGHTQKGNNNPWNQDNELSWLDWNRFEQNKDIYNFVKTMIAFRKKHSAISRRRFWYDDVEWYGTNGGQDWSPDSHALAFFLKNDYPTEDSDLYVMINGWWEAITFTVQKPGEWRRAVDTSLPSPDDAVMEASKQVTIGPPNQYTVSGRSVVVLVKPKERPNSEM